MILPWLLYIIITFTNSDDWGMVYMVYGIALTTLIHRNHPLYSHQKATSLW